MIKCVVWDLDDTLWHGTLGDAQRLILPQENRELLEKIDRAGVLQSVASRNDAAAAREQLERFGVADYFLYPQFGFQSKAAGLQRIAQQLNVGLDALAFVDDSDFELEEIAYFLPRVRRYHATRDRGRLERDLSECGSGTYENRNRRALIRADQTRRQEERAFEGPREDFLKSCAMNLTVRRALPGDLPRVRELVERTNQFKTFAARADENLCRDYMTAPRKALLTADLRDRFGEYGIIGVCFLSLEGERALIEQFCLSCRVGGRGIGPAFLDAAAGFCQAWDSRCREMVCRFRATEKNRPVLFLLKAAGFRRDPTSEDYRMSLPAERREYGWITINEHGGMESMGALDRTPLEKELLELVRRVLQQDVTADTALLQRGGHYVDSMNIVSLVCEIEERYGISFEDDLDLDYLDSVQSLTDAVYGKIKARDGGASPH